MNTAIAASYDVAIARPATQSTTLRRLLKIVKRTWGTFGVLALMTSSAVYAAGQLMTLAR